MEIIRLIAYTSIYVGLFTISFYLLGFLGAKKKDLSLKKIFNVSIIIPAYNEEKSLEKTVEDAAKLEYLKENLLKSLMGNSSCLCSLDSCSICSFPRI